MTLDKQAVERLRQEVQSRGRETLASGSLLCLPIGLLRDVLAALVPQEEEVGIMVERLRKLAARPRVVGDVRLIANDAADLLERLVGIQGK